MIKEHSFVGGLNTDNTLNSKPEGTLSDAMNISIFTESGNSTLSVQNIKGNTPITLIDAEEGYDRLDYVIVAIEAIRNDFIIFWAKVDNSGYGIIDKLVFNNELEFTRVELYKSISEATNLDLIPNTKYAIETDYVDSETIRVHITSDDYPLRVFNVGTKLDVRQASSYNLKNFDSKAFNRLVDELLVEPQFVAYVSGNLLNGSYQYAYRLLSKNGSYSLFSVGSNVVPVSPTGSTGSRLYVNGADTAEKEISGLGIRCSIDLSGIDTTYIQRIEIISLYYDSKFGTPTINIIESIDIIPTTTLEFTDETNEAKYGTLTYLELTASSSDLSMRSLASKDGSLFGQYVTENYFDVAFDARAYQFDINGDCSVINASATEEIISTGSYPEATFTIDSLPIVETADVINPDRDVYKYDKSGELGGEGLHIKYSFISTPTTSTILTIGDKAITKGYKQGEVYRHAIVFFDKGLASPAHWIGDIKIPDYKDINSGTDSIDLVQINFVVNTAGTEAWGKSFQIVYQEVTDVYRTVLAEGLLVPIVREYNDNTAPYVNPYVSPVKTKHLKQMESSAARLSLESGPYQAQKYSNRYFNIPRSYAVYTPELSLTGQFNLKSNLRIALIGEYIVESVPYRQDQGILTSNFVIRTKQFKPTNFVSLPIVELDVLRYKSSTNLDGRLVRSVNDNTSQETDEDEDEYHWISSTCLVLSTGLNLGLFDNNVFSPISYPAVRIYRDSEPYGGVTYNDRKLATYLPATGLCKAFGNLTTTRGDVSSATFECFRSFLTEDSNYIERNLVNIILFPVQSVYNPDYRYDKSFYNGGGNLEDSTLWPHFLQETGNVTGDLYKYDDAYSAIDRSKIYIALNSEFQSKIVYDTKVIGSDKSTTDRYINSWAVFKPNNFINLRGNCGECTSLVEFNDTLYSFQENGFSVISINPRVTQASQDGVETVLGTGTLLERAIYGSTEIGTSRHSDIIKSVQAIYFLDQNKNKIYRISGEGLESLSDTRGIESYLANAITPNSKLIGIYDNARKAVYFTVVNNTYEYLTSINTVTTTEDVTTVNVTRVYTFEYTLANTYLTCDAIAENATVDLDIEGVTYTFTCVTTVSDVDAEFLYDADVEITLSNLRTAISNKLTTLDKIQYYELILLDNTLTIKSLRKGEEYNLEPTIMNPVVDTSGDDTAGGSVGYKLIKDTTSVLEDNIWVVVDFSTAGGVDRIDLLKNGSIVAQSGVHQGSNYGFPDAEVSKPKIVDRSGVTVRELWKGQWSNIVAYSVGDIVKIVSGTTTDYYLAINSSTNSEPSANPLDWKMYSVGDFNTDDWSSDPVYDKYCYKPHFIGTNSYLVGGNGEGSSTGLIPTRYADFLAEVGVKSEDWLGAEGDAYDLGIIKDGVVSRYNGGGYPDLLRGQRVWAKYNTGDTYKIEAMGAGVSTGYQVYYWSIKPQVSNLTAIDTPSTEIEIVNIVETTTTTTETISKTKTVTVVNVLTADNRVGLITFVTGDTYILSGITDLFVLSKNVDYEFNDSYYRVVDIDYDNKVVELVLVEGEGVAVSEEVDLSRIIKFRNPFTLTFNEMLNKFDSFHSFIPLMYTKNFAPFYTINNDSIMHKHNIGNYGEYYGVRYNSYIDVVLPIKDVSRFTNASFYFWVSDGSERIAEKTLRSIKVFADGQESDAVILYPRSYERYIQDDDNGRLPNNGVTVSEIVGSEEVIYPYSLLYNAVKPLDRMWRIAIPRVKEDSINFSTARAHGSFCIVRLEMDNTDNYKQVLDTLRFKFDTLISFEEI